MVQALAFAELLAGGILFLCGYKGYSPAEVVKGEAGDAKSLAGGTGASAAPNAGEVGAARVAQQGAAFNHEGYVYPFKAPREGRIDQGQDFGGAGPIAAIGDAIVRYAGPSSGWPGSYIAYELTGGSQRGRIVYVAEGVTPTVRVGQRVRAGETIGTFVPGSSTGIETGWAQNVHPFEPLAKAEPGGYTEGKATRAGTAFAQFLQKLLAGGERAAGAHR